MNLVPTTAPIPLPHALVYHPHLPPPVIHTWLQLRLLADPSGLTPPLTINELSQLTHKSSASLYVHLSSLRSIGALATRATAPRHFIISFPAQFPADGDTPLPPPAVPITHTPFPHVLSSFKGLNDPGF